MKSMSKKTADPLKETEMPSGNGNVCIILLGQRVCDSITVSLTFNGIVQTLMKIMSSFIPPHFFPNLYDLLFSAKHKRNYKFDFAGCCPITMNGKLSFKPSKITQKCHKSSSSRSFKVM